MDKIIVAMTVEKVQTMVDGALRVTLDMSETSVMQMAQFVECKRMGVVLKAEFTPDLQADSGNEKSNQLDTGKKRKSQWTPA